MYNRFLGLRSFLVIICLAVSGCGDIGSGGSSSASPQNSPSASETDVIEVETGDGRSVKFSTETTVAHTPRVTTAPQPDDEATFVDRTSAWGISTQQLGHPQGPRIMVGGVSVADYDNDGWQDLVVTGVEPANRLYRNTGDRLVDVTTAAGLGVLNDSAGSAAGTGLFFDADGDDDLDLFVTQVGVGRTRLFIQEDGIFTDEAAERGVALDWVVRTAKVRRSETDGDVLPMPQEMIFGATAADVDHDGDLDLFTSQWRVRETDPEGPTKNRLFINDGTGVFEDQTQAYGLGSLNVHAFTATFADYDGDGWEDLFIAADYGTSRLLRSERGKRFTDVTEQAKVGTDENGMGSVVADFNDDGLLDWFVTSVSYPAQACGQADAGCSGNRLFLGTDSGEFRDGTDEFGVRNAWWGWGASYADLDNDGVTELVAVNGMIENPADEFVLNGGEPLEEPLRSQATTVDRPARVWSRSSPSAKFVDRAAAFGLAAPGDGKAVVAADIDGDLDLDLLVAETWGGLHLFENTTEEPSAIAVDVVGPAANRSAIGATVTLFDGDQVLGRGDVRAGDTFLGQRPRRVHFGLGDRSGPFRIEVAWPAVDGTATGTETVLDGLRSGESITITADDEQAR